MQAESSKSHCQTERWTILLLGGIESLIISWCDQPTTLSGILGLVANLKEVTSKVDQWSTQFGKYYGN